jgi:hypothetical protein
MRALKRLNIQEEVVHGLKGPLSKQTADTVGRKF